MDVLIVEDELALQKLLQYDIEHSGYSTHICLNGDKVLDIVMENEVKVILLDLMLPNKSGIDLCREIRLYKSDVYIIVLTAIHDEISKLEAFEVGADDYVTKPFSARELLARVEVGLKRYKCGGMSNILKIKDIEIDLNKRSVKKQENEIKMSYKEYELLKYLFENPNRAVSRDELLRNVWGYDFNGETRTVDVYMHKIRDKVGLEEFETVRNVGYMLKI